MHYINILLQEGSTLTGALGQLGATMYIYNCNVESVVLHKTEI